MSLTPVAGLGAPGVAELKLAVWRLGNGAIPRTRTESTTRSMPVATGILHQ